MYNPWSAHTHSHAHHAQAHTHPHGHSHTPHAQAPTVTSVSGPGTRLDLDSSPSASPSQSSYQMSQMRWLPSMITTRSHNHNVSLPTISSNLRMQHPHPAQQQHQHQQQQAPVSMIVDSRAPPPSGAVVGGSQAAHQQQVVAVESDDSDRSDSPGGTPGMRDVSGADALGEPEFAGDPGQAGRGSLVERGGGDIDMEILAENGGKGVGNGDMAHAGDLSLTTRKHGKRLTTKEEVSLFEICNRHASDFGQRSNLCKWWMTVTMEFTRGQKHPYSWHSVRRKVELVTKQRMKFLEEQRDKGASEADDLSNPRWRAVVDTWIPTWQRWEDAEARRIEKRDSRRPRKRKWTVTTPTSTTITTDQWDLPTPSAPGSGADVWRAPSSASSSPMVNHNHTLQNPNNPPATQSAMPLSSTPVRLPPGFDTLFSSQTQTQTSPSASASASTPFNPHIQRSHLTNHPSTPSTTNPNPSTPDNTMMTAVLETLGKLNKHLDSNPNHSSLLPNSTPTSNIDPSPSQPQPATRDSTGDGGERGGSRNNDLQLQTLLSSTVLNKVKEDLKVEMLGELRTEWDKERAVLEEKLDSVQRTQEMILEMLRQEPS